MTLVSIGNPRFRSVAVARPYRFRGRNGDADTGLGSPREGTAGTARSARGGRWADRSRAVGRRLGARAGRTRRAGHRRGTVARVSRAPSIRRPCTSWLCELDRLVFQERAKVLRGGLEVLAGQPDENRLGDLEEAAAFAPVEAGDLGTAVDRLQSGVDLDVERAAGALGGEPLVLGQRGADRGRLVGPAQERSLVEERGPRLERAVAGDASLGQPRRPDRRPGHVLEDGEDFIDGAADDGDDGELVHALVPPCTLCLLKATLRSGRYCIVTANR